MSYDDLCVRKSGMATSFRVPWGAPVAIHLVVNKSGSSGWVYFVQRNGDVVQPASHLVLITAQVWFTRPRGSCHRYHDIPLFPLLLHSNYRRSFRIRFFKL